MPFLTDQDAETIRRRFAADLEAPVRLLLFLPTLGGLALAGQESEIPEYTRRLVHEVAALSDRLRVEEASLISQGDLADRYRVTYAPTLVFLRETDGGPPQDLGLRYVGLPGGYELVTLLEMVIGVSRGRPDLAPATVAQLAGLDRDLHLQVFVTPT